MPARDGKLSEDERKTILESLSVHGTIACDVCDSTDWVLNRYLVGLTSDRPNIALDGGVRTPAATIICSTCGQMKMFAAIKVGISPIKSDQDTSEGDADG